ALLKGHVCGPVVRARRSSRVIGNLTSLMSTGTAIVLNDRVQIAGSTISAGGGIVIKKHVAVGGLTLADSTSTSSAIADCELARSQASDKYAQLSVLSPTLSLGTIKIKRAKSMRVPASGTLGDGVQVVQFDDLKLGGHTTLTFAGAPTTTHLVIRIPGKLRLMRDAKIVLDGLVPEQVIWVVDGETIIGGNARFQGTVLGTGSLSARLQSRIEGAFVGRTLKAGRTSIINRRPFVGWCD
ncbi:MAG TPA: choice-of-anchor A family protein, partial [Candidatus Acidoferrales bacterium]|nr:choice-of-anchor A family protein [Candidatus Acidoferrales bacterium]